jgi:hypothetical protein
MNKFYTLMVALSAATLSFGQVSYDLELELITPVSGSTVPGTAAVSVDFTVTNNGPSEVPAGDTLYFVYTDASGTLIFSLGNVATSASGFVLGSALTSGSSLSGSVDFGGPFSFDLSAFANGETCNVICLGSGAIVLTGAPDPFDSNLANNFDSFMIGGTASLDELNAAMIIYPNPAVNVLNVKTSEEVASMTVIGLDGSIISSSVFSNQVDVSTLVAGIYVYRVVTTSGKVVTDKFVKQ